MFPLRFRAIRKCWLVGTAIVSLVSIATSLSIYQHYESKADLTVLVAVPGLCLIASTIAVNVKRVFPSADVPISVAIECIWTNSFVVFNLILSLYSLGVGADTKMPNARIPFLLMKICCWSLTGLMATYSSLVTSLSILTAVTVDKDVWFRNITSSPSPFPVALFLYSTKLWLAGIRNSRSAIGRSTMTHLPHCLPRCPCKEKIPPSSPPTALPPLGILSNGRLDDCASAPSVVPGVRLPTALERHNSIFVGLEV